MSIKIVLVDDDSVLIHLHKTVVRRSGFPSEPLSFNDGKPAFEYLREHLLPSENYLILLDINMPLMDGWQFLEALQTLPTTSSVFIVIASSSVNSQEKERAFQYKQVIDYLEKPISTQDFKNILKRPDITALLD